MKPRYFIKSGGNECFDIGKNFDLIIDNEFMTHKSDYKYNGASFDFERSIWTQDLNKFEISKPSHIS